MEAILRGCSDKRASRNTMKPKAENIRLRPGESFRLLRWQRNMHDVEAVTADGSWQPFEGSGHEWHDHTLWELTLVETGSGTRFIGDSIKAFDAPDLVLIGPGLPHYWHMRQDTSGFALQFASGEDQPLWQLPEVQAFQTLSRPAQFGLHVTGPAKDAIGGLIRRAAGCNGLARLTCFLSILDALLAAASQGAATLARSAYSAPARQATYVGLQKAINRIFHSFHEPLRFSDILRDAHMSKATFERHFKRHTGKTVTQFVTEVRLQYACRQLAETDLPIGEIALASGFGNLSHFNHQFKVAHGLSPRGFRSSLRHPSP